MSKLLFDLQRFATPSAKNLLLGQGKVLFDRWDEDGNPTGLRHLGTVPKFDLTMEVDEIDKKQSMYAAKTTYLKVIKEITAGADITIEELDAANIAMAFLGEEGILTQVAGTVTDESHVVYPGKVLQLDAYKLSNVTIKPSSAISASIGAATAQGTITSTGTVTASGTYSGADAATYYVTVSTAPTASGAIAGMKYTWKKGATGTASAEVAATSSAQVVDSGVSVLFALTTGQNFTVGDTWTIAVSPAITAYTSGTDYKVEASMLRAGLVPIPESSRMTSGQTVLVSYTKPGGVYPKIAAAVEGSVEGYMLFAGDPTKGPAYNADFWHVSIAPSGSLGFIGDELASFDIKITVMDDRENHPDEPLYRLLKLT